MRPKEMLFLITFFSLVLISNYCRAQDNPDSDLPDILLEQHTVTLNNVTFGKALDHLYKSTGLELNYNRDRIPVDRYVSINMNNARLIDIIEGLTMQTGTKLVITPQEQFLIIPLQGEERFGTIRGRIIDGDNQRPLPGANIVIIEAQTGAAADDDGYYSIDLVEVGSYTLKFSFIGYEPVIIPDVIVKSDRITYVNAELEIIPLVSEEVLVTDSYFSHLETEPTSSASFSYEEIRRAATIGGDLTRVINGLPGISSENEGNHIVSRGGSTVENSFYIDGIQVPNINHFGLPGTTGGIISLVNIDYINKINIYTGGFSPQFGDRLSSVLDINLREGNRQSVDTQIDINFVGITAQVEGPVDKGRGSVMASARYGGNQFVLKLVNEDEQPSSFVDLQVKLRYDLSPEHQLSFINLYSDDDWSIPLDYSISNYWNWYGGFKMRQNIMGISWKYLWSERGYSVTNFSNVYYRSKANFFFTRTNEERYNINVTENYFQLRNINYYRFDPGNKIELGLEASLINSAHDNFFAEGYDLYGNFKPEVYINTDPYFLKTGAFLIYEWKPAAWLKLLPGVRADYFDFNNNLIISPRIAAAVELGKNTTLTGSAGIYTQNIPNYFLIQNENFRKLKEPTSVHYVVGLQNLLEEDVKLSFEYYYKKYDRLPFDADMPGLYLFDEPIHNLFFESHSNLVSGGSAQSNGIEVILQKKMSGKVYGLLAFSIVSSTYEDLLGIERSRAIETRAMFSAELGYKPSKEWEFNIRFAYASGRPYTPVDYRRSAELGNTIWDIERINGERLPDYVNLSVRADRRFYFSSSNLTTYVSIWNLFDRKNVSFQGYSEFHNTPVNYNLISIIPVFGIEYEF